MKKNKLRFAPLIIGFLGIFGGHYTYMSYQAENAYAAHRYDQAIEYARTWKDYSNSFTELYCKSYVQKAFKGITTKSIDDYEFKELEHISLLYKEVTRPGYFYAYDTSPSYRVFFKLNHYNSYKQLLPDQTVTLEDLASYVKKISAHNEKELLRKVHYLQINTQFHICTAMLQGCKKEPFGIYEYKDRISYFVQEIKQAKKHSCDESYMVSIVNVYNYLTVQMYERLAMYPPYDDTQETINVTLPILMRSADILNKSLREMTEYYVTKELDSQEVRERLESTHALYTQLLNKYKKLGYDVLK